MRMSRRGFLVAGGSAALSPLSTRLPGATRSPVQPCQAGAVPVTVFETGSPLRESLAGYEVALTSAGIRFTRRSLKPSALPSCRIVIVPGCGALPPEAAETLSNVATVANLVLLESGAGFVGPAEFEAHRNFLRAHFRLGVLPPLDLWQGNERRDRVPYVDYRWPHAAKIRDFSRIVPLAASEEHAIGRIGPHVVASKQRYGRGTLLFLGSPLGPALWAGDAEAHQWFRAALAMS